jgi:hypothetical protein
MISEDFLATCSRLRVVHNGHHCASRLICEVDDDASDTKPYPSPSLLQYEMIIGALAIDLLLQRLELTV